MCIETKKIIKCRNVVFIEDRAHGDDLEMCPSGRNKSPIVVMVNESSASPLSKHEQDDDRSQVRDANNEAPI